MKITNKPLSPTVAPARSATSAQAPAPATAPPVRGWTPAQRPAARVATVVPSRPAADPSRATVTLAELAGLQAKTGRRLSLGELAVTFPNARLEGKGRTLSALAKQPINKRGPDGSALTLAAGTVDKNGDVDVTRLFGAELKQFNQNLVVNKTDEHPIPLEFGLRNGDFCVGDPAHQQALAAAGFKTTKDGLPTFDMRDPKQVERALTALGVDPTDNMRIANELLKQGVTWKRPS